jgi:predicted site-specific integrase-resolvase
MHDEILYTPQQISAKYQISCYSLYSWIYSGRLKPPIVTRLGRLIRIREDLFSQWADSMADKGSKRSR